MSFITFLFQSNVIFLKQVQTLTGHYKGAFKPESSTSVLLPAKHLFWQTARSLTRKGHPSLPEKLKPALYCKGLLQTHNAYHMFN